VDIPYANDKLREFRAALGDKWTITETNQGSTFCVHEYSHSKLPITLQVIMMPGMEGSTCKRVKVGEKIVDIYEVRCGDEVQDE
jgi:hypothetical protein